MVIERYKKELKRTGYLIKSSPLAVVGIFLVALIVCVAIFAPFIAPYSPYKINMSKILQPPSTKHWFGTDSLGRDVFSRVVYGSRISLKIAFVVVSIAALSGTLLGAISGYYSGIVDMTIMRITDAFLAIPMFVLAMVAAAALGPSVTNVMLALSIVWWTWYARIIRGEVLKLKGMYFVHALRSLGASDFRIVFYHLIPNCAGPIIVQSSLQLGYAILVSAGLSFLGLGAQPPAPSWGLMVSAGRRYLPDYWWMSTFPGMAIFLLVMGFLLLGDTLRDVLEREIT